MFFVLNLLLEYLLLYVIIYRKLRINGEIFMLSDIEIAQNAKLKDISEIASMLGIDEK